MVEITIFKRAFDEKELCHRAWKSRPARNASLGPYEGMAWLRDDYETTGQEIRSKVVDTIDWSFASPDWKILILDTRLV